MNSIMNLGILAGTVAIVLVIGVFKTQGWIDAEFATVALAASGFGGAGMATGYNLGNRGSPSPPGDTP